MLTFQIQVRSTGFVLNRSGLVSWARCLPGPKPFTLMTYCASHPAQSELKPQCGFPSHPSPGKGNTHLPQALAGGLEVLAWSPLLHPPTPYHVRSEGRGSALLPLKFSATPRVSFSFSAGGAPYLGNGVSAMSRPLVALRVKPPPGNPWSDLLAGVRSLNATSSQYASHSSAPQRLQTPGCCTDPPHAPLSPASVHDRTSTRARGCGSLWEPPPLPPGGIRTLPGGHRVLCDGLSVHSLISITTACVALFPQHTAQRRSSQLPFFSVKHTWAYVLSLSFPSCAIWGMLTSPNLSFLVCKLAHPPRRALAGLCKALPGGYLV